MRLLLTVLLSLSAGACTGAGMSEKPLAAEEMPVVFTPQEVADGQPKYQRAYDDRTGADYRQAITAGRRAVAMVTYQSVPGDYVFSGTALRESLGNMFSDEAEIAWGDSGSTTRGAVETDWQAFELATDDVRMGCMGLRRELRHHAEVGNVPNTAQAIAVAYLCRQGPAMTADDAVRVAAVLRERT